MKMGARQSVQTQQQTPRAGTAGQRALSVVTTTAQTNGGEAAAANGQQQQSGAGPSSSSSRPAGRIGLRSFSVPSSSAAAAGSSAVSTAAAAVADSDESGDEDEGMAGFIERINQLKLIKDRLALIGADGQAAMAVPSSASTGAATVAGSSSRLGVRHHAHHHHRRLPLRAFVFGDVKCPVCNKIVPSDEVEIHLVMCLTRPRITYNEDTLTEDSGECVICFEDMLTGETIARLPCLCIYHKTCIDAWFRVKNNCPEHPSDD